MRQLTIACIVIILLICSHCENLPESAYRIVVRNKSLQSISVFANYILPDTTLPQQKPEVKTIHSGEFGEIYDSDVNDEKFERMDNERLTIFILSTDTIEKYSWDTIKEDYKILKRYEILSADLVGDGSISYP